MDATWKSWDRNTAHPFRDYAALLEAEGVDEFISKSQNLVETLQLSDELNPGFHSIFEKVRNQCRDHEQATKEEARLVKLRKVREDLGKLQERHVEKG